VRKSSLVEWSGADNVSRLKHRTEAVNIASTSQDDPRGRSLGRKRDMVGERSVCGEARPEGLVEGTEERMPE